MPTFAEKFMESFIVGHDIWPLHQSHCLVLVKGERGIHSRDIFGYVVFGHIKKQYPLCEKHFKTIERWPYDSNSYSRHFKYENNNSR